MIALRSIVAWLLLTTSAQAWDMRMISTGGCECCHAWAKHLRAGGHQVKIDEKAPGMVMREKLAAGVPAEFAGCHTAWVGPYLIEGHVPLREIERLMSERPAAKGLIVAGMPVGSPGMENGDKRAAYNVLILDMNGKTSVYASYAASGG